MRRCNHRLLEYLSCAHTDLDGSQWPFSLSHNRLEKGGYAREQNVNVLPVAEQIAGVDMRLKPGAYRELHWHTASEWAYMLK